MAHNRSAVAAEAPMDLACAKVLSPIRRRPRQVRRRRRPGQTRARVESVQAYSERSQPLPGSARSRHATVAELNQIPGARQALADYIGILQEWSARADESGAAP